MEVETAGRNQGAAGEPGAGTAEKTAEQVAAASGEEKAAAVRRMFDGIAPRYDLLNHLLSLSLDRYWRRRTVDRLLAACPPDGRILDSCAGTLDLALQLAGRREFSGRVVACDFSLPMLVRGTPKASGLRIDIACADALRLPFPDATFDGAMIGFGLRNLASVEEGLAEFHRVLRPGAPLLILEFTTPTWQPLRGLYLFYFRRIVPRIGGAVSGHASAYEYLPTSVMRFPEPAALAERMREAGFRDVAWETFTAGTVALHRGLRAR